ncbi:MAG TPA: hypothetical protein VJR90_05730 [Gammaproteobacteria bacterium]|nr:hypothetical protein [Gammaproteobacteria bacterium]
MRRTLVSLGGACLFVALTAQAQNFLDAVKILPKGNTIISTTIKNVNVVVTIKTHEIQNGTPSHIDTTATKFTSCTNSRVPCSVVDNVTISVNGKNIFVPRSVFCDLADLDRGMLVTDNGNQQLALIFWVGDAAEAYIVKIDFNNVRVTRRRLSLDIHQRELLQDTKYYLQSFDG